MSSFLWVLGILRTLAIRLNGETLCFGSNKMLRNMKKHNSVVNFAGVSSYQFILSFGSVL